MRWQVEDERLGDAGTAVERSRTSKRCVRSRSRKTLWHPQIWVLCMPRVGQLWARVLVTIAYFEDAGWSIRCSTCELSCSSAESGEAALSVIRLRDNATDCKVLWLAEAMNSMSKESALPRVSCLERMTWCGSCGQASSCKHVPCVADD